MSLYDDPERTVVIFDLTGVHDHARTVMQKTLQDLRRRFPDAPIFEALDPRDRLACRPPRSLIRGLRRAADDISYSHHRRSSPVSDQQVR